MNLDILNNGNVAVIKTQEAEYPIEAPYNPNEEYSEYMFGITEVSKENNYIYEGVREAFISLNLDAENISTPNWNPLKEVVKPGDFVVLKPNFVIDRHENGGELFAIITHPAVIRAVCDYVLIALKGVGEILIADAPQANTNFENVVKQTHLKELVDFYREKTTVHISFCDLRQLVISDFVDSSTRETKNRDPRGYSIVDLTEYSELRDLNNIERIYGADYDRSEIREHHNSSRHEYCVANSIINADVIINLPKVKTHRKAGVTLSMKNLVGINGNKNYLPHFRIGTPEDGGDEYKNLTKNQKKTLYTKRLLQDTLLTKNSQIADKAYSLARKLYGLMKKGHVVESTEKVISAGSWSGNETIWRTIIDLNRILIYSDKNGNIQKEPQRKYLSVIDGVWAGENEGPLIPSLKKLGYIVVGFNPLIADLVTVKLMGFDYHKIPLLDVAVKEIGMDMCLSNIGEEGINIKSNVIEYKSYSNIDMTSDKFNASEGWKDLLND